MKNKDKKWTDLKLSELVDQSLGMGFVPIFRFLDKDTVEPCESKSPMEETPASILEKEIRFYGNMIKKIQTKEGIVSEGKEVDEKLSLLEGQLTEKIKTFQEAISLLNSDIHLNGASQGTMPNEPNPDNQKSYSELEKEWKQKLCDGVDNLHELFKAKLKEKEDEITQLKAALSKAQSKITELLIERDERK